jgi:hypothetical protein
VLLSNIQNIITYLCNVICSIVMFKAMTYDIGTLKLSHRTLSNIQNIITYLCNVICSIVMFKAMTYDIGTLKLSHRTLKILNTL